MTLQNGDTIIEVLLAFTVFSLVAMSTLIIMNQGTNTAQRSLEITMVRQQIDAQAEALRAVQQASVATTDDTAKEAWQSITTGADGVYAGDNCPTRGEGNRFFVLNPATAERSTGTSWYDTTNASPGLPFSHVSTEGGLSSYGLWIERERIASAEGSDVPDVFNFSVNACWYGPGSDRPMKLETSVRLYDPL